MTSLLSRSKASANPVAHTRESVMSLLTSESLMPWEVQGDIGHRSLVITCNTYGHRYPGSSRVEEALMKFLPA